MKRPTVTAAALILLAAARLSPAQSPPPSGKIRVAFAISEGATMIDFAGPWEVFQDVMLPGSENQAAPFELFTVGAAKSPLQTSGGMTASR